MPLINTCAIGCLLIGAALAQKEDSLQASIAMVRYPPIAEQARIQGDVYLEVNSGAVTLISGHPLLAPPAIENAKTLASIQGQTKLHVTYRFVLVDTNLYSVPTVTAIEIRVYGRGHCLQTDTATLVARR